MSPARLHRAHAPGTACMLPQHGGSGIAGPAAYYDYSLLPLRLAAAAAASSPPTCPRTHGHPPLLPTCTVIMLNKYILAYGGFPYPITLTMGHMLFCATMAIAAVRLGWVESPGIDQNTYLRAIVPIGICYALTLWVGVEGGGRGERKGDGRQKKAERSGPAMALLARVRRAWLMPPPIPPLRLALTRLGTRPTSTCQWLSSRCSRP